MGNKVKICGSNIFTSLVSKVFDIANPSKMWDLNFDWYALYQQSLNVVQWKLFIIRSLGQGYFVCYMSSQDSGENSLLYQVFRLYQISLYQVSTVSYWEEKKILILFIFTMTMKSWNAQVQRSLGNLHIRSIITIAIWRMECILNDWIWHFNFIF